MLNWKLILNIHTVLRLVAFWAAWHWAGQIQGQQARPHGLTHTEIQRQISQLIQQLGNENFRVRRHAQQELEKVGLAAYEQLREALDHPQVQVARSAEYLLKSQNIVWWLETDSHEVRSRLEDYGSLDHGSRLTRLLELANRGTDDALLALARIAKYENDELCSRGAALALLEQLQKRDQDGRRLMAHSVLLTLGDANRTASQWLSSYCTQLSQEPAFDISVWENYANQWMIELSSSEQLDWRNSRKVVGYHREHQRQGLRFYEWLTTWVNAEQGREQALTVANPCLKLVSHEKHDVHEFCIWVLSVGLPELIVDLNRSKSSVFESHAELQYLLAEAQRKLGDEQAATATAGLARTRQKSSVAELIQLARSGANDVLAKQRMSQAINLVDRGLFDWAEAEFKEAILLNSRDDAPIRLQLAELYREGKQYRQARETLEVVANSEPPDKGLPLAQFDHETIVASYHWLRALEANDLGKQNEAVQALRQASEHNQPGDFMNPDIIITFYRTAYREEDKIYCRNLLDDAIEWYRSQIAFHENHLAQSASGSQDTRIAEYCNQLAWLLVNCETNLEEAIYLSRRSLEFDPDTFAYLDTLARCYYGSGKLAEAVAYQRQAMRGSPHNRSMLAQLAEFEAALQAGPPSKP